MKVYSSGTAVGIITSKNPTLWENTYGGARIGHWISGVVQWKKQALPIIADGSEDYANLELAIPIGEWTGDPDDHWEKDEYGEIQEKEEDVRKMKKEKILEYIEENAAEVVEAYYSASWGERITFYIEEDGTVSHVVGQDVGNEISCEERPEVFLKCPGIGNIDSTFWTDGWTHRGENGEILRDDTGEGISLEEAIHDCCVNGDIITCVESICDRVEEEMIEDECAKRLSEEEEYERYTGITVR